MTFCDLINIFFLLVGLDPIVVVIPVVIFVVAVATLVAILFYCKR